MSLHFATSVFLPAPPEKIYAAWLDSDQHAAMTGGPAATGNAVGDRFDAWGNYISGTNLELSPFDRIVQAWRTVEFAADEPDSRVELQFQPHADGTLLTLYHSNLPPHGEQYRQGWVDHYFEPMKRYFQKH